MAYALKTTRLNELFEQISSAVNARYSVITGFFTSISQTQKFAQKLEEMHCLTDVELAEKFGINRDQITTVILRDLEIN